MLHPTDDIAAERCLCYRWNSLKKCFVNPNSVESSISTPDVNELFLKSIDKPTL